MAMITYQNWIVNTNSVACSLFYHCVTCRSLRKDEQLMCKLPSETSKIPPFTYCSVDLFGPFTIKL